MGVDRDPYSSWIVNDMYANMYSLQYNTGKYFQVLHEQIAKSLLISLTNNIIANYLCPYSMEYIHYILAISY